MIFLSKQLGSNEIFSIGFGDTEVSGPGSGFAGDGAGGGVDCVTASFGFVFAGLRRLGRGLAMVKVG
jgi:hypothetical protein